MNNTGNGSLVNAAVPPKPTTRGMPSSRELIRRTLAMAEMIVKNVYTIINSKNSLAVEAMYGEVVDTLVGTSDYIGVNLVAVILCKIVVNRTKYPVDEATGEIVKTSLTQKKIHELVASYSQTKNDIFDGTLSFEMQKSRMKNSYGDIMKDNLAFVTDRKWELYETPERLTLAVLGEIGELCEHAAWLNEELERAALIDYALEMADIYLFYTRLFRMVSRDLHTDD